jgi:hypothetical protein
MPLLDHFRPPIVPNHSWESFHSNWATRIADGLNELLPPDYLAEEHTSTGSRLEIDVATYEKAAGVPGLTSNGPPLAVAEPTTFAPPVAPFTTPLAFPDSFAVRVFHTTGGLTLVGVSALVSPGNKDRPEERKAFITKLAGYLHQGISLVLVDVVTTRKANLHNDLMRQLSAEPRCELPAGIDLYAVAYRPVSRGDRTEADLWPHPLAVGRPLPSLPLRLTGDLFVPVHLETSYQEACRRRRLG